MVFKSDSSLKCVRKWAWCALCLALLAGAAAFFPARAFATFADQAKSFPAMQDLGSFEDPITGDQLPDGTYQVTARTSSSMCIFYTDPANAESRDSKEQAIISVQNGSITAIFYISKAYNFLYMGPQEEAAAATNAEGTDASAYIAGDPPEGYVPHLFAMAVPALNVPITFSSFSGGNNGIEKGVWYTREVVFGMSHAELEAYVAEANGSDMQESEQDYQPDAEAEEEGYAAGYEEEVAEPEDDAEPQAELRTDNINTGEEGEGSGSSDGQSDEGRGVQPSEYEDNSAPVGIKAVRMNIVGANGSIEIDIDESEEPQEIEMPLLTPRQILGLVLLSLFIGGLLLRVVLFKRGLDRMSGSVLGSPPVQPPSIET